MHRPRHRGGLAESRSTSSNSVSICAFYDASVWIASSRIRHSRLCSRDECLALRNPVCQQEILGCRAGLLKGRLQHRSPNAAYAASERLMVAWAAQQDSSGDLRTRSAPYFCGGPRLLVGAVRLGICGHTTSGGRGNAKCSGPLNGR